MSISHSVVIQLPEGQRLADLSSISSDLFACADFINLYKSLHVVATTSSPHQPTNFQLTDCVVTALFVRYARCFKEGARVSTQLELKKIMTAEDLKVHHLAINIRDKHYSHSVNSMESPHISVSLSVEPEGTKIMGVSCASHVILAPDAFVFDNLSILIGRLHKWVIEEEKKESARLLPIVKKQYSAEQLSRLIGKSRRLEMTYADLKKKRKGV